MAHRQSHGDLALTIFGLLLHSWAYIAAFTLLTLPLTAQEPRKQPDSSNQPNLSVDDCRKLVLEVSQEQGSTKLPGFGIENSQDSYFPEFYFFDALWNNPDGSVVIGHFAVDPQTADVWDAVVCRRYHTTALSRLQRSMRQRIGLTNTRYNQIRRSGPMC